MDKRKQYLNLVSRIAEHDSAFHPHGHRAGEPCRLRAELEDLIKRGKPVSVKDADKAEKEEQRAERKADDSTRFESKVALPIVRSALDAAGLSVSREELEDGYDGFGLVSIKVPTEFKRGLVDARGAVAVGRGDAYTTKVDGAVEAITGYLHDNGYPEAAISPSAGGCELLVNLRGL